MNRVATRTQGTIVAVATALVFSTALYEQENIIPASNYEIPDEENISISNRVSLESINSFESSILKEAEIINSFEKKLSLRTKDVDSKIVDLVNDEF